MKAPRADLEVIALIEAQNQPLRLDGESRRRRRRAYFTEKRDAVGYARRQVRYDLSAAEPLGDGTFALEIVEIREAARVKGEVVLRAKTGHTEGQQCGSDAGYSTHVLATHRFRAMIAPLLNLGRTATQLEAGHARS